MHVLKLPYHFKEGIKMDFPSSLDDQQIEKKKKSLPNRSFLLLIVVLLSVNLFFLFFDKKNLEEMVKRLPLIEESNPVESQIKGSGQKKNISLVKTVSSALKTQQVSFSKSEGKKFGDKIVQSLELEVRNSLNYTICKIVSREEGCASLSAHLGRLMSWFFDVNRSIRNGDVMRIVFQKKEGPEQFKVLKLSYKSQRFGKSFEANYFEGLNQTGYFDLNGNEIAMRIVESQSPIRTYTEITSLPGDFRKRGGGHSGTDFKAPVGTPVYSGFKGIVNRVNWNVRANGYCVEIDHPDKDIKTLYLHLSRVFVKPGQTIKPGQQIAESGNTGRTFAPHLHYEIQHRKNRNLIYNPFKSKHHKYYTRKISIDHLEQFKENLKAYNVFLKQS